MINYVFTAFQREAKNKPIVYAPAKAGLSVSDKENLSLRWEQTRQVGGQNVSFRSRTQADVFVLGR